MRKTKNSNSTNRAPKRKPRPRKSTKPNVPYADALSFVQGFVHYHVDMLHSLSNDFEKQRYNMCANEIVCDVFKEKYNLPPFDAAVLMLHFGIEMLILQDVEHRYMQREREWADFIKDTLE